MRVHELAKQLSSELDKQITSSELLVKLNKKKEGLRPQSNVSEDLIEYIRGLYIKKPTPVKTEKPKEIKEVKKEDSKPVKKEPIRKEAAKREVVKNADDKREAVNKDTVKKEVRKENIRRDAPRKEATRNNERNDGFRRNNTEKNSDRSSDRNPDRGNSEKRFSRNDGSTRDGRGTQRRDGNPRRDGAGRRDSAPAENIQDDAIRKESRNKSRERDKEKERDRDRNRNRDREGSMERPMKQRDGKKKEIRKPEPPKKETPKPVEPVIKSVTLPEVLTVSELAGKIKVPVAQLIKKLFMAGKLYNVNSDLSFDEAAEIALEYNYIAEEEEKVDVIEELLKEEEEDESLMTPRPPVVCVMGHVDHGKTSLLDAIRHSDVTAEEAGGITQHIGASVVKINSQRITFLDTPGHEAFTAMRMRGAQSTDIAILVVAADDGVMPQTVEAINHAKAAGIEIIVAINKIDKESANIDRVKQELMEYELVPEDWGGSTIFCPVSAHTKEGIDNLLEMIILTSEILELKANKNRKARGIVIEAQLDKGRGSVATVLVQKGTLKVGDYVAVGAVHGKVRAMFDDKHRNVKEALPSTPVEILGLNGVPESGEIFMTTNNEKEARQISDAFINRGKEKLIADTKSKMSLDDLYNRIQEGNVKDLNLIIKADVQGSVEAVKSSLLKLSNEEVAVKCIHSGVGAINESDVILASASNAIIIGFNIRPDNQAKDVADREKVDIRLYRVIYNAIEDIESAMKGMLDPIYEEKIIGHAEVRQTYKASGVGTIAGSYVLDGVIQRNCTVRVSREGEQIFEGPLASLKRFKDDVKEVKSGFECGIVLEDFNDIKVEDQIEAYIMEEVPR
ncbi:MAG: translation initiation factor IF-2 [Lachnospiraceae bacterium]|nr:translation initiation factor IF-2 [Lachnospiraceae bacterium]